MVMVYLFPAKQIKEGGARLIEDIPSLGFLGSYLMKDVKSQVYVNMSV